MTDRRNDYYGVAAGFAALTLGSGIARGSGVPGIPGGSGVPGVAGSSGVSRCTGVPGCASVSGRARRDSRTWDGNRGCGSDHGGRSVASAQRKRCQYCGK